MVAAIRARTPGRDLAGLHDGLRHDLRAQQIRAEALQRRRPVQGSDRHHAQRRAGLDVEVAADVARAEDGRTEVALRARPAGPVPAVSRRSRRSADRQNLQSVERPEAHEVAGQLLERRQESTCGSRLDPNSCSGLLSSGIDERLHGGDRRRLGAVGLLRPTEGRGPRPGQHACRNYETHYETLSKRPPSGGQPGGTVRDAGP